ncbi:hypothetical protein QBC34DRAFT_311816 [Podospora aff. communis PSN243]|uniref:Rhodopsin domain-containing protein n=1 Tax=Podospora aff. communis PSN243 TaxID=3040156 RepID=A0AAV9G6K7_9PEZI|nr:hypothetical protein QBC34DRAFT_311816 [Podospora aff. communis PSN243]
MLFADRKIDYGPRLNALLWLMVSVSALFLFTRLYLKKCQMRGLWWDDYILLGAWVCQTVQVGLVSYLISLGYGKPVIPKENTGPVFSLVVNLLSSFLITSNLLGKISFGLTLLRIPALWIRLAVWYIIITLTATLGMSTVLVWIECLGVKRAANCIDVRVSLSYNMFSCIYSAAMDVVLAFLPWKFIWSLQMGKKEKLGVVVAMSMGVFAGAAAAMKTVTFPTVISNPPVASMSLIVWGNAESSICIMAASIPILRALVREGFHAAVPLGYRTDETGYTRSMSESGARNSVVDRSGMFGRQLAVPIQPPGMRKQDEIATSLDRTLVSDSPEPGKPLKKEGGEWSDDDSFEMSNYQHRRPQDPKDFLHNPL